MKFKLKSLFLMVMFFAINSFAQTGNLEELVNDTFDGSGALPSEWTEYNTSGRITVSNNRLKFNHNTTKPSAYRNFTPTSNNSSFSFEVSASRAAVNCQVHLISSTGKYISSVALGKGAATIKFATAMSNNVPSSFTEGVPIISFPKNTVFTVNSEINFISKTVDFFINGNLVKSNVPFLETAENASKIDIQLLYMYANSGQFYFDNISLLSESDLVFSLENAKGIITDNLGSVIEWENQIEGYGDATQSNTNLGAEESQETYPGKTTVLFNKDGSFLEMEGTNNHVSDNNYTVFYVGKAENTVPNKPAALFGNYDMSNGFSNCKGIRFVKLQNGKIGFDYARPNYKRVNIGTNEIPADDYFFFGFSMDTSGNYKYFDSGSTIISTGKITNTMFANTNENLKFNLFEEVAGAQTYNQTEVVEFSMYDLTLDDTKFQQQFDRLTLEYTELIKSEFSVIDVLPENRTSLSSDDNITINFSQNIDSNSVYPKIFVNKSNVESSGTWNLSSSSSLTFTPTNDWPVNALVSLQIQAGLKSTGGVFIGLPNGNTYNYIVKPEETFNYETIEIVANTVDFPIVGHKLPIKITRPTLQNPSNKFPVHIWVHGGGWSGGTPEASNAAASPHKDYLAENLGIVTLSISYRCFGSSGTFSLARADVQAAYDWAVANANTYNLDMSKVFFSGGSAGSPLGAIAAEENNALGFIGFNGIYDFVNDAGDFGTGNSYKQNIPSEQANSPIFQLTNTPTATILMHGDADTTISHTQSTLFADAINTNGGDAEAIIYPGEVHAFFNPGKSAYEDVLIEMVNFINRKLNEQNSNTTNVINKQNSEIVDLIDNKINVFPNPVNKGSVFTVQLNSLKTKTTLQIVNNLGQTISIDEVYPEENKLNIDTKNLKRGNYILKLVNSTFSKTFKFIVQ